MLRCLDTLHCDLPSAISHSASLVFSGYSVTSLSPRRHHVSVKLDSHKKERTRGKDQQENKVLAEKAATPWQATQSPAVIPRHVHSRKVVETTAMVPRRASQSHAGKHAEKKSQQNIRVVETLAKLRRAAHSHEGKHADKTFQKQQRRRHDGRHIRTNTETVVP